MRVISAVCLLIMLLSRMYGAQVGNSKLSSGQTSTSSDESAGTRDIRHEVELFRHAVLTKDMRGIARYYWNSPELVVFDVITPLSYVGWESFRKDWEGFFIDFKTISVYDWTNMKVEAAGNLGYLRAFIHLKGELNNGEHLDMIVRDTAIFRRINGRWKVIHDHGSVPFDSFQSRRAVINAQPQ